MSLPTIRVNTKVPFPTRISGYSFVKITKANGVWTVAPDYTLLQTVTSPKSSQLIAVYDTVLRQYQLIPALALVTPQQSITANYRIVTGSGDVSVLVNDTNILMDKTVGAATNIILPPSASRGGIPVTVKDIKGDANAHLITFVPASGETIDGLSGSAAAANGVALIDVGYTDKTLCPLLSGGWFVSSRPALSTQLTSASYRAVSGAGDVTIVPGDVMILVNKTVGQATNVILPPSSTRAGIPLTVKDFKGDSNTHNITFVPSSGESIDGFSAADAAANGVAVIDVDYTGKTIFPLLAGGWYIG